VESRGLFLTTATPGRSVFSGNTRPRRNSTVARARKFPGAGCLKPPNWPDDLSGLTILEAGFRSRSIYRVLLKTGAAVISFDLSSAVESNYRSNGRNENLLIVQASIFDIPVRPRSMDKVICLGVLQHTPDPKRAFLSLANCVRPGGELVVDVYAARLRSLLSWKYLLRPITKRMDDEKLYGMIERRYSSAEADFRPSVSHSGWRWPAPASHCQLSDARVVPGAIAKAGQFSTPSTCILRNTIIHKLLRRFEAGS